MATNTGTNHEEHGGHEEENGVELQIKTKDAQETGCCGLTSRHESNQVRVTRSCFGPLADLFQSYQQFRWTVLLCCNATSVLPVLGRWSISDVLWTIFIIVAQILFVRESFDDDSEESRDWWYNFGLHVGELANFDYMMVWLLGQRNTILNIIFGVPMERSIKYHRYIAWLAIFNSWLHFICVIQYWLSSDDDSEFTEALKIEKNIAGLIMLSSVSTIFCFTLDYIRRNYWEIFLKSHWILFCTFLWAAVKHDKLFTKGFFLFALICWGIDLAWRGLLIFNFGSSGTIVNVESLAGNITKITWKKKNFTYDGGQYCFICIPAIDLTQWHPFSISSSPDDSEINGNENTFHIKAIGDFTSQLSLLSKQHVTDWSRLQVYFEGPYGKLEVPLERFDRIVLISGGIGITPMQSLWGDLMSMIEKGEKFNEISFVWYIRNPKMIDEFDRIHWNSVKRIGGPDHFVDNLKINGINIKTTYVFTKVKNDDEWYNTLQTRFGSGFVSGRPHCGEFIGKKADNTKDNRTVVCGCGPGRMLEDMQNHCANEDIDCHTEVFTF